MEDQPPLPETLLELLAEGGSLFGWRLLRRASEHGVEFETVLATAQEMIEELPREAANYLAALVAQDILRVSGGRPRPVAPRWN